MSRSSRNRIAAFLVAITIASAAIADRVVLFNQVENEAFLVFVKNKSGTWVFLDELLGRTPEPRLSWFPPGIVDFTVPTAVESIKVVLASDTTVTAIVDGDVGRRDITIRPNPSSGPVWIWSPGPGLMNIFDVNGRLVEMVVLLEGDNLVEFKTTTSGVFFFTVPRLKTLGRFVRIH